MRHFLSMLLAVPAVWWPAQDATAEPCGEENLLAGRQPAGWFDVFRPEMVTDGIGARDGDPELGTRSAVLASDSAVLEYDLGTERRVTAVLLQIGANARYVVELSPDRRAWAPLLTTSPPGDHGLRTRVAKGLDGQGRYLRLTATGARGGHAVSELQIFCRTPATPPIEIRPAELLAAAPEVALAQAQYGLLLLAPAGAALLLLLARRRTRRHDRLSFLASGSACVAALTFAASDSTPWLAAACGGAVALAAAVAGLVVTRRASDASSPRLRCTSAALLVGLAAMAYTDYGRFGGYWSVHYHDVLHYMLGAKYAPELRYDGLYPCLLEANGSEQSKTGVMPAAVRDLREGHMVPSREMLARPSCRDRFAVERWQAFQKDVAFFMAQLAPADWVAVFTDHGYNATPVWTWLWRPLFGARPASLGLLEGFAHVDEVAYVLMALLAIWAWGPERGAAAALLFGMGFPWIYLWTGGGVGRSLWLVALVAALALGTRRRFGSAGIALGFSSAIQFFPALVLAGPALLAWRRDGHADSAGARRVLLAALVTGSALVLLSFQVAGPSLWLDFVRNTVRHLASDSANRIGPSMIATGLGLPQALGWLLSAAVLGVWAWAALRVRDAARLLSLALLVPVFALRLSSYYLALVLGLAPLLDTPGRMAAALLSLLAVPQAVAWIVRGVPGPGAYAWMSVAIVGFGVALCVLEARRSQQEANTTTDGAQK